MKTISIHVSNQGSFFFFLFYVNKEDNTKTERKDKFVRPVTIPKPWHIVSAANLRLMLS